MLKLILFIESKFFNMLSSFVVVLILAVRLQHEKRLKEMKEQLLKQAEAEQQKHARHLALTEELQEKYLTLETHFQKCEELVRDSALPPSDALASNYQNGLQLQLSIQSLLENFDVPEEQMELALKQIDEACRIFAEFLSHIDTKKEGDSALLLQSASELSDPIQAESSVREHEIDNPISSSEGLVAVGDELPVTTDLPPVNSAQLRFLDLQQKHNMLCKLADSVKSDACLRPNLSRAVGIINLFNNDDVSVNRSKLQQINNLLSGKTCIVGDTSVSTAGLPEATAFVKEQLASRIVSLGHDKQVTSMAIYASVAVKFWQWHPDLGELILYYLYEACPYLIPSSPQQKDGQAHSEYIKSLGMRLKDDGTAESFNIFLTRMNSAARYFAHIIAMDISQSNYEHPFGLHEGWKFIAGFVTFVPVSGVTAAVLRGFLSTAGCALLKKYGQQFMKLMKFLCDTYLAKVKAVTVEGGEADLAQLEKLLESYATTGKIQPPQDGYSSLV